MTVDLEKKMSLSLMVNSKFNRSVEEMRKWVDKSEEFLDMTYKNKGVSDKDWFVRRGKDEMEMMTIISEAEVAL